MRMTTQSSSEDNSSTIKLVIENEKREVSKSKVIDYDFRERESGERKYYLTCERGYVPFYSVVRRMCGRANCHVSEYAADSIMSLEHDW